MADTISSASTLLIETSFIDGDTRTLSLKNPDDEITTNAITELNNFLKSSNILIGDRNNADFNKIMQVRRRDSTTSKLDIT